MKKSLSTALAAATIFATGTIPGTNTTASAMIGMPLNVVTILAQDDADTPDESNEVSDFKCLCGPDASVFVDAVNEQTTWDYPFTISTQAEPVETTQAEETTPEETTDEGMDKPNEKGIGYFLWGSSLSNLIAFLNQDFSLDFPETNDINASDDIAVASEESPQEKTPPVDETTSEETSAQSVTEPGEKFNYYYQYGKNLIALITFIDEKIGYDADKTGGSFYAKGMWFKKALTINLPAAEPEAAPAA